LVPELDRLANVYKVEKIYYVHLEYTSDLAKSFTADKMYDYKGTPLVLFFEDGVYSYSNFSYTNPDSNRYDEDSNYYLQIIDMFESF
jgi:hypothetical protein